jgi:hypothetical protein
MNRPAFLIAIACSALAPAFGQLYLIAGSPTPKHFDGYSTVLAVVGADGSVKNLEELVPANLGTDWMTTSYDARKALILPRGSDGQILVFDFDAASVIKSCPQRQTAGLVYVGAWLVDSPSHGLMFTQYLAAEDRRSSNTDQFSAMILDSTVPCQNSFVKLDASEIKYVVADGFAGIADIGSHDSKDVAVGSDGALSGGWLNGERTYYDYKVPASLLDGLKHPAATILVNNKQILGLFLAESADRRLLVLRKSDNTWHQVPDASVGRGFGSVIATSEAHEKDQRMIESVGKRDWHREDSRTGPAMMARLPSYPLVYPGVLHLYDAATENFYTIRTNQADSEILLVENDNVYYRVGNRLYSAPFSGKSIGAPKLLATDELIRDAHWAFIKR